MQTHTVDKYGGMYSESTEPIDASSEIRTNAWHLFHSQVKA